MATRRRNYPLVYNDELQQALTDVSNISSYTFTLVTVLSAFFAMFSKHMHLNYVALQNVQDQLGTIISITSSVDRRLSFIESNITNMALEQETAFSEATIYYDNVTYTITKAIEKQDTMISDFADLLSTQFTISNNLSSLYTLQESIKESIDNIDVNKIVADVIDETGFELNCPNAHSLGFDGLACENDPLGFGPINCDAVDYEEFSCARAELTAERIP